MSESESHSESQSDSQSESDYDVDIKALVQGDLELCVKQSVSKFAHAMITATPDPGLTIEGVGPVTLPLSPEFSRTSIGASDQAPFGKGDATLVDKKVRDTWEVDASKIKFTNPERSSFIKRTAKDISSSLGVDLESVKPKPELHKLLIYEKDSHFLPHVNTEKSPGMFATMVIVLPSHFEGGAIHILHSNQRRVIDVGGPKSGSQAAVLAWYTDVIHEVKPVTSGYRFALAYNLLRSQNSAAPLPAPQDEATLAVRNAFKSWARAIEKDYESPSKLAWFLDHRYSHANMSRSALKGRDAHLVNRLRPLAQELRLKLGLASLSVEVSSPYPDDGGDLSVSWMDGAASVHDFDVGYEFEVGDPAVEHLVDMDGRLVSKNPSFSGNLEEEFIPDWDQEVGEWLPDRQEYEGYLGNEAGNINHYYRKTVLVIWPEGTDP